MELKDAEKIINEYGSVLANNPGVVHPLSILPYSKEKIKEAIKSYYIGCTILGILDSDFKNHLEVGYVSLATFIEDEKAKICLDFYNWSLNNLVNSENDNQNKMLLPENIDVVIKIQEKIQKDSELLLREVQTFRKLANSIKRKIK